MANLNADIQLQGFMRAASKAEAKRAKAEARIQIRNAQDQAAWLARCVEASRKRYAEIDAAAAGATA